MEYLLYGLSKNESEQYMETLLLCTKDKLQIDKVIELAKNDGWHSFRACNFDLSIKPEFAKTVNI